MMRSTGQRIFPSPLRERGRDPLRSFSEAVGKHCEASAKQWGNTAKLQRSSGETLRSFSEAVGKHCEASAKQWGNTAKLQRSSGETLRSFSEAVRVRGAAAAASDDRELRRASGRALHPVQEQSPLPVLAHHHQHID